MACVMQHPCKFVFLCFRVSGGKVICLVMERGPGELGGEGGDQLIGRGGEKHMREEDREKKSE